MKRLWESIGAAALEAKYWVKVRWLLLRIYIETRYTEGWGVSSFEWLLIMFGMFFIVIYLLTGGLTT